MNNNKYLFLVATLPVFMAGMLLFWLQGIQLINVAGLFLMLIINVSSVFYFFAKHAKFISWQEPTLQKQIMEPLQNLMAYTEEIERLFLLVSPKLFEQILAARELTEQEIADLIGKFSIIFHELQKIIEFANDMADDSKLTDAASLKNNAQNLCNEIDGVMQSLQFQDRVSQILTQVEENLTKLTDTVEQIQLQGNDRHRDMVQVEEMLTHMQNKYESVNQLSNRAHGNADVDELTFF